jgi:hypothetical protein
MQPNVTATKVKGKELEIEKRAQHHMYTLVAHAMRYLGIEACQSSALRLHELVTNEQRTRRMNKGGLRSAASSCPGL